MHATLSLALCALVPSAAVQEEGDVETRTLDARDGTRIEVEYGTVDVPEVRGDPGSATLSLAWLRVRSRLDAPGAPVFVLAGGPGASSLEMVEGHLRNGGTWYVDMLGGDVIAIDQRGVGRSRPSLESATPLGFPLEEPGEREAMLARMRAVFRAEAQAFAKRGVDLRGYTTVESADDVDAVRRALGYEKIALWGASYASHLALATLRRHGDHVARAVLIAPEGPDHTLKLPSSAQSALERLAEMVAEDPEAAADVPDLLGALESVLARLGEQPVVVEVDGTRVGVSAFDVQRIVADELGTLRGHAERLPALVAAMERGVFEDAARTLAEERRTGTVGSAMFWVMDSASGASAERARHVAEEARECLLGDAMNFPFPGVAEAWGAPDLGADFRAPVRSEVPVLLIVGDFDYRTPVANAEELARHLPKAHVIVVENAGHGDLNWLQPELRDAWHAFLSGREVAVERVRAPGPRFGGAR